MAVAGAGHLVSLLQEFSEFFPQELACLPNLCLLLFGGGDFGVVQRYPEADNAGVAGLSDIIGKIWGVGRAGQVLGVVRADAAVVLEALRVLDSGYRYQLLVALGAQANLVDVNNLNRFVFQVLSPMKMVVSVNKSV